jgi:hypothetical protein
VIHFFRDRLGEMAHKVDGDVEGECLRCPLLGGVGVVASTETGRAIGVEPCPVGSAEDVFGAVGRVCEGNKGWVVGEVGRVGPRRRIRDRQRTGRGEEEVVEEVPNGAEVVECKGEKVDSSGIEVCNEGWVVTNELCSCCCVVCLSC